MKICIYDTHKFEREFFLSCNENFKHEIVFFEARLNTQTVAMAKGADVVCAFVNDKLNEDVLKSLQQSGIRLLALRSAGFNHVDLKAAERLKLPVVRVPEYSPYAVAEHAVALILTLNRKTHKAYNRVREANFNLDGLVGFDLHGKTVGVIGTGKIGSVFARIMHGFGARVLAYDIQPNEQLIAKYNVEYKDLPVIFKNADIISLHVPLTTQTKHMLNASTFEQMKKGVMIINTGRGALIDTHDLIAVLKTGKIGAAGLDVYEEEENIFFRDMSETVLQDDMLARLLTFPNVLITSHQAFLTQEALKNIATTTLQNVTDFEQGKVLKNQVRSN